jgi:hypothetical protein
MKIHSHHANRSIATVIAAVMCFSGCATSGGTLGGTSSSEDGGCNPAATALLGAIIGAAIDKNNRARGAALGGAAGGLSCVAWNYKVNQVKTAEQLNQQFKVSNNGTLPREARVISYSASPQPSSRIAPGNPIVVDSRIGVVDGVDGKKPIVEQEIVVIHDGKVVSRARKAANLGLGAGEYQTSFQVNLPRGVPQGNYPVQTTVFLNGQPVQRQSLTFQVV